LHAQQLGPFAQVPGITYRQRALATAPWHGLNGYTAYGTIETAHAIKKNDSNTPKRHVNKLPLRQVIITRALIAAVADALTSLARFNGDLYAWFSTFARDQSNVFENKIGIVLFQIKNSLNVQLHSV
jgi:hypothetical protein